MKRSGPRSAFVLLTLAVGLLLLLPKLAQDGMFMDGMLYTTVSHNEAQGFGTFWEPRFSELGFADLRTFHEHPPLVFGMQAMWFRLFGSAFWVERAWCLFTAVVCAWLLLMLWRALVPPEHGARGLAWWPVLLWIMVPQVHWSFQNNMQENSQAIFVLAAILCVVRAGRDGSRWGLLYVMAGASVFLAVFAKGIPGFFPLGAPLLHDLAMRRRVTARGLAGSALMTVVVAGIIGGLWLWPEARTSLSTYVNDRLLHRIESNPTVAHRWETLKHLFMAFLGPLLLAGLVAWAGRRRVSAQPADGQPVPLTRAAWSMAMIGLSGILPMMLTLVQKSFYLVPAFGPLAVALALATQAPLLALIERIEGRSRVLAAIRWTGLTGIATAVVLAVVLFGRPGRDEDMLHDVHQIGGLLPAHTLIGADDVIWEEWNMQCYLMRYHFLSIAADHGGREWVLTEGEAPAPEGYRPSGLDTRRYVLWQRE